MATADTDGICKFTQNGVIQGHHPITEELHLLQEAITVMIVSLLS